MLRIILYIKTKGEKKLSIENIYTKEDYFRNKFNYKYKRIIN